MKRPVQEPVIIDEGKHTGVILDVEERQTKEGYNYIDLHLAFKQGEKEVTLKASYPDAVSLGSKLGKLLQRFTIVLVPGEDVELNNLKEKKCEFMTINKDVGDKTYSNVIVESVKPVE